KVWALGGVVVLAREAGLPPRGATVASTATIGLIAATGALVGGLAYALWHVGASSAVMAAAAAAVVGVPLVGAEAVASRGPTAPAPPEVAPGGSAGASVATDAATSAALVAASIAGRPRRATDAVADASGAVATASAGSAAIGATRAE